MRNLERCACNLREVGLLRLLRQRRLQKRLLERPRRDRCSELCNIPTTCQCAPPGGIPGSPRHCASVHQVYSCITLVPSPLNGLLSAGVEPVFCVSLVALASATRCSHGRQSIRIFTTIRRYTKQKKQREKKYVRNCLKRVLNPVGCDVQLTNTL